MTKTIRKLLSELPAGANVTISNYSSSSKQAAEDFVKTITGEEPKHDSLYGTAWCQVSKDNLEVIAYYDEDDES